MNELGPYLHATPTTPGQIIRGGCVRFDTDTPRIHANSAHASVGLVPASLCITGAGMLHVALDVSLPVVITAAFADETLAARGITAGVSSGVGELNIRFHLAGHGPLYLHIPAHYDKVRGANSNVWLMAVSLRPEPTG